MPELSRFYGIVIYMFWKDHAPPHFHAEYNEEEVLLLIDSWEIYRGSMSPRALKLVREWAEIHREEIIAQWNEAIQGKPIKKIAPLE